MNIKLVLFSQQAGKTRVELVRYNGDDRYYLRVDGMNMESFTDREWALTCADSYASSLYYKDEEEDA